LVYQVLDPKQSVEQINRYWAALKIKALRGAENISSPPLKSIVWSTKIYNLLPKDRTLSSLLELEQTSRFGKFSIDGALLFAGIPAAKKLTHGNLEIKPHSPSLIDKKLSAALNIISTCWPDGAEEIHSALIGLVPLFKDVSHSYSNPKLFGLIFINWDSFVDQSSEFLATTIVHEAAHHALFVATALDRLIVGDAAEPVFSPIKNTHRPAIAAIHGLFSMSRMLLWARKIQKSHPEEYGRIIDRYYRGVVDGLAALGRVELTPAGLDLLFTIRETIDEDRIHS
jgi:HEXXH motif-containing protein